MIKLKLLNDIILQTFSLNPVLAFRIMILGQFDRFMSVLALLMPVKVMFLLVAGEIPGFFPDVFKGIEFDYLMILLSLLSFIFYIFSKVAESVFERDKLRLKKYIIKDIENDESDVRGQFLDSVSDKVCMAIRDMAFFVAVLLMVAFLYPLLCLFIIMCVVVFWGFECRGLILNDDDSSSHFLSIKSDHYVEVSLFFSFFFIVFSVVMDLNKDVFNAFICFILMRIATAGIKKYLRSADYVMKKNKCLSV